MPNNMIKSILNIRGKEKKRALPAPLREKKARTVPAERFNEMIEYYTNELRSRLDEIQRLKEENEMLIKTSLKNASRSDELRQHLSKVQEDNRKLQQRLKEDR